MTNGGNFILFSDVKRLFMRHLRVIVLGALLFGGIGFWARAQVPVKYEVKATFQDGGKRAPSQIGNFENLLKNMSVGGENQGDVLMTSSLVLEPVIEKLGLQVIIEDRSKWQKRKTRFFEALLAEKRKPLECRSAFVFENVSYLGPLPKTYYLYFFTKDTYEIRDQKETILFKGKIGEKAFLDQVSLTIKAIPNDIKLHTFYPLQVQPLQEAVLTLRSEVEVIQNTSNPGVFKLTVFHGDLFFGRKVLNSIMEEYQKYLTRESKRVSEGQMHYLEKRRHELCLKMSEHLQSHAAYLKRNIQEKGSLTLGQHLPIFQKRKDHFSKDLMDLKLKREKLEHGEAIDLGQEMATLQGNLHLMMKERDELSLALFQTSNQGSDIATHLDKLDQIEKERLRIQTGIDAFFINLLRPFQDRERAFLRAAEIGTLFCRELLEIKKIEKAKKELSTLTRINPHPNLRKNYLENNLRLLSLQEEALKNRLLSGATQREEYQGIDIQTAKKLLLDYLHKRDDLLYKYRRMEFGKKELEKEAIEHISFTEIFSDSVSQKLIKELGEMTQSLRKKRTLTEREIERLEKNFASKKEDLSLHIREVMELLFLEKESIEERIHAIQITILDLTGQEIALIERQVKDRIDEKLGFLDQEEELIQKELVRLKNEMEKVPDQWLREKELAFTADMNQGMLESLVQLVESKNIENNLLTIESKPINTAYSSFIPKNPFLKAFGLIGAFIGGLIVFVACFIGALYKGFPIGLKNLATRGRKTIGTLKNNPEKNLEVFRSLSLILHQQSHFPLTVTLILGKKKSDSTLFAELLAKEGKHLLLIDLSFSKKVKEESLPGLASYLEGKTKEPAFILKDFGDLVSFGKAPFYAQELLKSPKFDTFLEKMKERYDVVLLSLNAEAKHSLPKHFFPQSDVIALRLNQESYDDLIPYLSWEDEGNALAYLG